MVQLPSSIPSPQAKKVRGSPAPGAGQVSTRLRLLGEIDPVRLLCRPSGFFRIATFLMSRMAHPVRLIHDSSNNPGDDAWKADLISPRSHPEPETHRRHLVRLACRMLGSVAEAEDAVQDAYLRWHGVDWKSVTDPRAYLSRTVTRLCLDRLRETRKRWECYIGPWLPEPLVEDLALDMPPGAGVDHDVTYAMMLALERLSPLERAALSSPRRVRNRFQRDRGHAGSRR